MRIVSKRTLREFWEKHPDAENPLRAWHAEANAARWRNAADVKDRYPNASILKDNRLVFNIGGNKFRLVVKVNYGIGVLLIRFVGTHADYDKIDAEVV